VYSTIDQKIKRSAITVIADATFSINHPTAAKTVIPECGAPPQILLPLVTFRYTYDRRMWRYGITVIAHEALFCKSGKNNGGD
jgi:hypothetical protein